MSGTIKLLALDLDGTLALEDNHISPATQRALYQLHHEEAVEVVIATGRRYRGSRSVIDNLGFEVFCVCCDGALVKDPDRKTLLETSFSHEEVNHIVSIARHFDIALIAQRDSHTHGGKDFFIDNGVGWNPAVQRYFEQNTGYAASYDLLNKDDNFLVLGGFEEDVEKLRLFSEVISNDSLNRFHPVIVPFARSSGYYCGITLKHVTKWHGLDFLASNFGIGATNICAVGDQLNDLAMVQAAGLGVAMGNGSQELKHAADMVCGNHDQDGLLDVISQIRSINT